MIFSFIFWRCSRPSSEPCFASLINLPITPSCLSWQRPPNIPEDVPLTYHLQITNLTSNEQVLTMTDRLLYPLPGGTGCSLFTFSVTASNDVGNSTTSSIMETVPISKFYECIRVLARNLLLNGAWYNKQVWNTLSTHCLLKFTTSKWCCN